MLLSEVAPTPDGGVEEVWENSRAEQLQQIDNGALPLERPGDNQLWVRARDNAEGDDLVNLGPDRGKWRLIE